MPLFRISRNRCTSLLPVPSGSSITYVMSCSCFLKSKAWRIVFPHVYGPAMRKAKLFQEVLHHDIITVRVHTQMSALPPRPFKDGCSGILFGAVSRHPVDDSVRAVINPLSVCYLQICRLNVFSLDKKECARDITVVIHTNITVSIPDIIADQLLRRPVGRSPCSAINLLAEAYITIILSVSFSVDLRIIICSFPPVFHKQIRLFKKA